MPNIVAVVLRGWVAFISALGLYAYLHNSHFAWFPKVILALVAFGLLGIAHRLRSEENEGTWNTGTSTQYKLAISECTSAVVQK
jgi:hypothetical protein